MSLHSRGPISRNISVDDSRDVATIYGIDIAGELLRTLGEPTPSGQWFRIVRIENGSATIETKFEEPIT